MATDNYRKHTSKNPLQRFLIERFYSALVREVVSRNPTSILDAGCGEGFTLARFRHAGITARLEGIELNPESLALGRSMHADISFVEGSLYDLPYEDQSFDLVVCSEVLEHLDDPEKALREIARVTKRYAVISVPHEPFFMLANFLRGKNITRFGNDREHIQHWSRSGIARFVSRFFRVRTVRNPFPWTIVVGEKQ